MITATWDSAVRTVLLSRLGQALRVRTASSFPQAQFTNEGAYSCLQRGTVDA